MYKYIYWELTGGGLGKDWYHIYFAPQDGRGFYFGINGKKHKFSWVHPEEGHKCNFNIVPENIQYSLLHYGRVPCIKVPRKTKANHNNLMELINADKDFKIVSKEHVKAYIKLEKAILNSLKDALKYKEEVQLLRGIGIPLSFAKQIFRLNNTKCTKVVNGEIGTASFINGYKLGNTLNNILNKDE